MEGKRCFLKKIISDKQPNVITLQETHFKKDQCSTLSGYSCFFKNRLDVDKASGGVAVYIKNDLVDDKNSVPLKSDLEIIAVSIPVKNKRICIANVYIPNSCNFTKNDLNKVASELPKPFVLVGDFNSHNVIWGSKDTDPRGKIEENFVDESRLIIINDGEATYFNKANGSSSTIDLAICSPSVADRLEFEVMDDLYSSDHFPIYIQHVATENTAPIFTPRWKFYKADWSQFQAEISASMEKLTEPDFNKELNVNDLVDKLTECIISAATIAIPKTKAKTSRRSVPWWNEECEQTLRQSKHARNVYKKHRTLENKILFNKATALFRRA